MKTKMRNSKVKKEKKVSFKIKDIEDLQVLEQIKSGKVNAYEFIYKKYYQFIQYHCFLSVKSKQVADDLAVEILTKIYLNIDKYQVKYTFNSWVWGIARNHLIDHIRKSKNEPVNINKNSVIQRHVSNDSDDLNGVLNANSTDVQSDEPNPEELIDKKEVVSNRKKFVKDLLDSMSERDRQILVYYYFEDMSYEEISKKLNIPLNTMKVTLMRSKEKLKNSIGTIASISHLLA
jgi:RNA polymerase sigma factor (sigma-70 family)